MTAANSPLPTTGPIELAAPVLGVELGEVELPVLLLLTLAMATPLTPVAFLHWSSESSWAVELNLISAHCPRSISVLQSQGYVDWVETYVVQSASALAKLNNLDRSIEAVQTLVVDAAVTSFLESLIEVGATRFLYRHSISTHFFPLSIHHKRCNEFGR